VLGATGKNLKEEIDDLAAKGKLLPVMQESKLSVIRLARVVVGYHWAVSVSWRGRLIFNSVERSNSATLLLPQA
jgi:hypothetical protein